MSTAHLPPPIVPADIEMLASGRYAVRTPDGVYLVYRDGRAWYARNPRGQLFRAIDQALAALRAGVRERDVYGHPTRRAALASVVSSVYGMEHRI